MVRSLITLIILFPALSFGEGLDNSIKQFMSLNSNPNVCQAEVTTCEAKFRKMPKLTPPPNTILGIRPYSVRAIEFAKHYQKMSEELHAFLGEPKVITSLAFESHVVKDVSKNLKTLEDSIAMAEKLKATKTGDVKAIGSFLKDFPGMLTSKQSAIATYRYGFKPFIDLPIEKWGWHNLDQIIADLKELHENMAAMNMHIFSYMTSPDVSPLVIYFKQIAKCDPDFKGYMDFPNDHNGILREAFHKLWLLHHTDNVEERKNHSYDFSILLIAHEQMYAQTYYDRINRQHEKLAGLFQVNDPVGNYKLIDENWSDFKVRFSLPLTTPVDKITAADILKTTRKEGTITGYYQSRIFSKNALTLLKSPEFPAATTTTVTTPAVAVDQNRGVKILTQYGCLGCHSTGNSPSDTMVGPNLGKIGSIMTKDQIRESIVNPNAEISNRCDGKPCTGGIMPPGFKQIMKPEEIDALVDYLSKLK